MKTIQILLMLLLFTAAATAQNEKRSKESSVKNVRIYQNGAQVERQLVASVDAGATTLFIEGLSSQIDQQSISVNGTGDATVSSVAFQLDYLTGDRKPIEVRRLEDSLRTVNLELEKVNGLEQICNDEISLLNANKSIGGANIGVDVDMLKEVSEYYRNRMVEIKVKLIDIHSEQKALREKLDRINRQLADWNAKANQPQGTIVVNLLAKQKTTVSLKLSYYTTGASWSPAYELRAKSLSAPVLLAYKANVVQNTGEIWDNVHLFLSTGNPSVGGSKPLLNTWYLDFYQPMVRTFSREKGAEMMMAPAMQNAVVEDKAELGSMSQFVAVQDGGMATEFDIALPYSVKSDGKPVTVDIQSDELPATYMYYVVPKLDKDAFLLARITGWDKLNLLPGEAKVYYEGNYVGESMIDPYMTADTLDLSLGRDKRIMVTRELKKEFSQQRAVGGNMVRESLYEISVRNTKKEPVQLILEDQVPVSQNSEIKVSTGELSGGSIDPITGKVTWRMEIAPGATEKRLIGYSVKFPKGKVLPNF